MLQKEDSPKRGRMRPNVLHVSPRGHVPQEVAWPCPQEKVTVLAA